MADTAFAPLPRLSDARGSVGKPRTRRTGRAKVTGTAPFTAEWDGLHGTPGELAGLLHVFPVTAPIAKGTVTNIDAAAARAMPGVVEVLTPENSPNYTVPEGGPGLGYQTADPAGQREVVHAGQYVAAVVADSFTNARDAALAVRVSYESDGDATVDIDDLRGTTNRPKSLMGKPPEEEWGDPQNTLGEAAVTVDAEYVTPFNHHNMLEPHATIAAFGINDAGEETLTVWETTQFLSGTRGALAGAFGLKPENVTVICEVLGGAFGGKGGLWPQCLLACKAAKRAGRPVKINVTRRQLYGGTGHRSPTVQRVALGADEDGTLTSIVHEGLTTTSRRDSYTDAVTMATRTMYAAPNIRLAQTEGRLDTQLPTFMRAPAETPGMLPLECQMDELAERLEMDPIALRIENEPAEDPTEKKPYSGRHLVRCLEAGAERFGWADRPLEPRRTRDGRWLVGTGVASANYPVFGFPTEVSLTAAADGTILARSATHEIGTGTATVMAQLLADLLGVPAGRARFDLGTTEYAKAGVTGGSATALSVGSAIRDAVEKLKGALLAFAAGDAAVAGIPPEKLRFVGGRLVGSDSEDGPALEDLLDAGGRKELSVKGKYAPGASETSNHSFGAQFVEVGVDEEFGLVRVRRMLGCFACGTILNRKLARSQFLGGMIMGIGSALLEKTTTDTRLARFTNDNLAEYHVPVNADVPHIEVMWVDEPDFDASPIGAKGVGEIGITGVNAAIANAVWHATGKRHRTIPITPEAVLA